MNRKEKIKLIQAVSEGKLLPEDMAPARNYIFMQSDCLTYWEGKNDAGEDAIYSNDEFQELRKNINAASHRRQLCGLEEHKIFMLVNE